MKQKLENYQKPSKKINKILDKLMDENTKKNGTMDTLDCLSALRFIAILRYLDGKK